MPAGFEHHNGSTACQVMTLAFLSYVTSFTNSAIITIDSTVKNRKNMIFQNPEFIISISYGSEIPKFSLPNKSFATN